MVLGEYKTIDDSLNRLGLEQNKVENLIDIIDADISRILNESSGQGFTHPSERKNIANSCLEIARKVK
jgi:hypothetical protein